MRVLLAGPVDGHALADSLGCARDGVPVGYGYSPLNALIPGLLDLGVAVELVTLDPSLDSPHSCDLGPVRLTTCPVRGAPRYRARARSGDLFAREIAYLRAVIDASRCDVVHAHWTYEFAEAALRSGKPHLITMHDVGWDCLRHYRDPYRAMRLIMKYRVMLRARAVSAVSPYVASQAWHYGYFGKADVVPNPIAWAPLAAKSPERPVIVTVGSDSHLKNVAASLAAFSPIRARFASAQLHLFGPGLDAHGAFSNAPPGVTCHGEVAHDRLMHFLQERATLLIHPSRSETFGLIIGEAKMRGVPVVAGRNSGGVGYVVGEAGGVLVDINQPARIASAALALLSAPDHYRALQQAAHDDAHARFGVAQVASGYLSLYRRIAMRRGACGSAS